MTTDVAALKMRRKMWRFSPRITFTSDGASKSAKSSSHHQNGSLKSQLFRNISESATQQQHQEAPQSKTAISLLDVQKLLLFALFGIFKRLPELAVSPHWCKLANTTKIAQLNVVLVENCDWIELLDNQEHQTRVDVEEEKSEKVSKSLAKLRNQIGKFSLSFPKSVSIVPPPPPPSDCATSETSESGAALRELLTIPLIFLSLDTQQILSNLNKKSDDKQTSQQQEEEEEATKKADKEGKESLDRTKLLLSKKEMREENIALPRKEGYEDDGCGEEGHRLAAKRARISQNETESPEVDNVDDNDDNNNDDDDDDVKKEERNQFRLSKSRGYSAVTSKSPMFGLDCEMVGTRRRKRTTQKGGMKRGGGGERQKEEQQREVTENPTDEENEIDNDKEALDEEEGEELSELAHVSLVDENGQLAYSAFVRPRHPISDYRTWISGITRDDLIGPDVRSLAEVQRELDQLLPSDAILIGHSICFDLKALRLFHPYVIDTSVIFRLNPTRKSSLKQLSKVFLRRTIQNAQSGHKSAEDALATVDLVKVKLRNGIRFGHTRSHAAHLPSHSPHTSSVAALLNRLRNHYHHNDKQQQQPQQHKVEEAELQQDRCVHLIDDVIYRLLLTDEECDNAVRERERKAEMETRREQREESGDVEFDKEKERQRVSGKKRRSIARISHTFDVASAILPVENVENDDKMEEKEEEKEKTKSLLNIVRVDLRPTLSSSSSSCDVIQEEKGARDSHKRARRLIRSLNKTYNKLDNAEMMLVVFLPPSSSDSSSSRVRLGRVFASITPFDHRSVAPTHSNPASSL